jgi:hypothetical protein
VLTFKFEFKHVLTLVTQVELVVDPNAPLSFAERVGYVFFNCLRYFPVTPNANVLFSVPNKIARAAKAEKPKPVAKPQTVSRGRGGARGGRGGNSGSGRSKPKTAEQLDQEMADYFGGESNGGVASAASIANGGDVGMDDTVLVGTP